MYTFIVAIFFGLAAFMLAKICGNEFSIQNGYSSGIIITIVGVVIGAIIGFIMGVSKFFKGTYGKIE